jgi:hypothetical protein
VQEIREFAPVHSRTPASLVVSIYFDGETKVVAFNNREIDTSASPIVIDERPLHPDRSRVQTFDVTEHRIHEEALEW